MSIYSLRKEATKVPAFSAKAKGDDLCLDIMDIIGADFFGDGVTASSVMAAMAEAKDAKSITVNINSPGGDAFEGVAIYNLLKASGKPVAVNVVGLAASAASIIAMAGKTRVMNLGTQMMIHEALAMGAGHADDLRQLADTLDTVSNSIADIYAAETGLTKDKVLSLMKAETWMNAEDAKNDGFVTAVSKDQAKVKNSFDLSIFKNAPAELQSSEQVEEAEIDIEQPAVEISNNLWEIELKLKQIQVERAR